MKSLIPLKADACGLLVATLLALTLLTIFFERKKTENKLKSCCVFCFDFTNLLLNQSFERSTKNLNRKSLILIGVWALSCIVLTNFYVGVIMANSLAQTANFPFDEVSSLADCMIRKKCRFMVNSMESAKFELLNSSKPGDPYFPLIDAIKLNPPFVVPNESQQREELFKETDVYLLYSVQ